MMSVKMLTLTESELLLVSRAPNFSVCRCRLRVSAPLSLSRLLRIISRCVTCAKQAGHLTSSDQGPAARGVELSTPKEVWMGALQEGRVCRDSPLCDETLGHNSGC